MNKTICVDIATYKRLRDYAESMGTSISGAVSLLVERGLETRDIVGERERELSNFRDALRRVVKSVCKDIPTEDLMDDEALLQALESVKDVVDEQARAIEQQRVDIEAWNKFYRLVFACPRCGKTDGLKIDRNWVNYLRDQVRKAGWGHQNCMRSRKA